MRTRMTILLCAGTGCLSGGSNELRREFENVLEELGIKDEISIIQSGCFGLCEKGPVVIIYPDETFYAHVKVENVRRICVDHIYKGQPVKSLVFHDEATKDKVNVHLHELGFYILISVVATCKIANELSDQ